MGEPFRSCETLSSHHQFLVNDRIESPVAPIRGGGIASAFLARTAFEYGPDPDSACPWQH